MSSSILCVVAALLSLTIGVESQFTNLPTVPQGVFNVSTRIEISGTTVAAWGALTNFPAYANWNPFVRAAIVTSPLNITLPEQYPVENKRLFLRVQIPPLPLPVTASSPDNVLNTQFSYENITHVQPDLLRLAWIYLVTPPIVLESERWQGLTDLGNGKVLYESREVFYGAFASTLKALYGDGLQKGFDAQGLGLKRLLEGY